MSRRLEEYAIHHRHDHNPCREYRSSTLEESSTVASDTAFPEMMSNEYDILTLRIVNCLIDDEEALEEIYLDANYERKDNCFWALDQQFRLSQVLRRVFQLEDEGLIRSRRHPEFDEMDSVGGLVFSLTDRGRAVWQQFCSGLSNEELYHRLTGAQDA